MSELKYLRPNLVVEPLVDNWYAWSHLISPATAAVNILGRHVATMESYLSAPEIHAEAVLNPKMLGGPFMDLKGGRISEVQDLLKTTLTRQSKLIDFAKAIKTLDKLLSLEGKGYCMEALYEKVPLLLRGYVELIYDRNNNADFRFFEALLYESEYYSKASQSIALWITNNDHRPFCLSTPRLKNEGVIHLPIPFDHHGIDELAKMKRAPGPVGEIADILGIAGGDRGLFETFFTNDPPKRYRRYTGDKIRMRYFGHACILIETSEVSVLVDPLISYYGYFSDLEHFSDADLPDVIDYVLITHNHQDHILFETLLPLRHKIRNLIVPRTSSGKLEDPDLNLMFKHIGYPNTLSIGEMESVGFADARITGVPFTGEHCDLNIQSKSCYLVEIGKFRLLFLADSRIIEPNLYRHIQRRVGKVDVVFMGMECDGAPMSWLYGPLFTKKIFREDDNSRRFSGSDCSKGMVLVDIFQPREVYVYAMGQEPWVEFISSIKYTDESNPIVQSNKLVNICNSRGIVAERLYGEKELLYEKVAETV